MKTSKESLKYTLQDLKSQIDGFSDRYAEDLTAKTYFGFPLDPLLTIESSLLDPAVPTTAYFSMEFGLAPSIYNTFQLKRALSPQNQFFTHEVFSNYWLCDYLFKIHTDKMLDIPIYGGGLGVLAGDSMKSAADLRLSLVGLGVLWNKGYFKQNFWYKHGQVPEELQWDPHSYPGLVPLKNRVTIDTREGPLVLRLWKYYVYSYDRKTACPLVLLDSNLPENPEHFRKLTDQLYRSDNVWWKIFQRVILGIGGMKALDSLRYTVETYHLNEGHAAFAIVEKYLSLANKDEMETVKRKFVFTCHTPVAAGHDRFQIGDLQNVLGPEYVEAARRFGTEPQNSDQINLTFMSLKHASKVNAVAAKHGEVMRIQFPDFAGKIDSITNGIHTHTWVSPAFAALFDRYEKVLGDWRAEPEGLVNVVKLKDDAAFRKDIFAAHQDNKRQLMEIIHRWGLKDDVFTLGWARRIAGYKRPALIFHDVERLLKLAYDVGPLQIILAGKAHPNDNIGSAHIDEILDHIDQLNAHRKVIRVMILENYDTYFGKLLSNSVDVWLNNPLPPFEASGTSGMKAIVNGVLQLTTLDGWVVEAKDENIGWIFGYQHKGGDIGTEGQLRLDQDSRALCDALFQVMTLYYQTNPQGQINLKSGWIDKMIQCVKCAGHFNTQRMLKEYRDKMWSGGNVLAC